MQASARRREVGLTERSRTRLAVVLATLVLLLGFLATGGHMADLKEFLNPNATLTPGIAGGLAISISLPLAINFGMSVKWPAIVVSFLLGSIIILSFKDPISSVLRLVYWVLNSLIIFATAIGVGINVDRPPAPPAPPPAQIERLFKGAHVQTQVSFFSVAQAMAQPMPPTAAPPPDRREPAPERPRPTTEQKAFTKEESEALRQYLQQQEQYQKKQRAYDKRWSW
jgi:hypothetical protein